VDPVPDTLLLRKSGSAVSAFRETRGKCSGSDYMRGLTKCFNVGAKAVCEARGCGFASRAHAVDEVAVSYLM
jgi:hypothetical protein